MRGWYAYERAIEWVSDVHHTATSKTGEYPLKRQQDVS